MATTSQINKIITSDFDRLSAALNKMTHLNECVNIPYNSYEWRGAGLNRRPRAYESLISSVCIVYPVFLG